MKLGAFWGLTAPMIVLLKNLFDKETYEKYVSILNISGNTIFLTDFQKEMKYLLNYIDSFPYSYESVYNEDFNKLNGLSYVNGVINSDDSDLAYLAEDKIWSNVGIKVVQDLEKNKATYSRSLLGYLDGDETIRSIVHDFCMQNAISLDNTKASVIKILKKFKNKAADDCLTKGDIARLCEYFELRKVIPDSVVFDGNKIILSDIDKSFLSLLINSRDFILDCISAIKITRHKEIPIFDTTFHSFIRRKPTSLYYTVMKKFDYVKTTNAAHLRTTLNEARDSLSVLKQCISEYLVVGNEEKNVLTDNDYQIAINSYDTRKALFFTSLRDDKYLYVENLLEEDLAVLSNMYDIIAKLNCEFFSQQLGCSINQQDFITLDSKMQAIGIYGLNLFSMNLFKEFIRSVMLITTDKIQKSEEEMEELNRVVSDVQALFDSMISIGGELNA